MSKSSSALFAGIYRGLMRSAAPILLCTAILVFVGRVATYVNMYRIPLIDKDPSTTTNIYFLMDSLIVATSDSALIFAGAAIACAVNTRAEGGGK